MGEAFIVRKGGKEKPPLVIEAGLIVGFFGADTEIPFGWDLCDGTKGNPDLRDLFIIGAGDLYAVENTGGSVDTVLVEHSHTSTVNSVGNHTHSIPTRNFSAGTFNEPLARSQTFLGGVTSSQNGAHTHTVTINEIGESGVGKNLPPFCGLLYIIKLEEN